MRSTSLPIWLLAAAVFLAGFSLFHYRNDFPFYYHPDEPGKVRQVMSKEWNFHHPMLMLSTTRLVAQLTGGVDHPQKMVETGRKVSAAFAAGGAAFLTVLVWRLAGGYAAAAAGILLISNRQIFELAHYFKEDTALFFGVSAWFLAMVCFWKRPGAATAMGLGVGSALAVSGKYVGVVMVLLSLILLPLHLHRGQRARALVLYLAVCLAVVAFINLPLLMDGETFRKSFNREIEFVVGGQRGLTRSIPHPVYLDVFRTNIIFVLWPLLAWFYWRCWKRRAELSGVEWLILLFPLGYMLILSFSPKENDRYFLPATALFLCVAAMGTALLRDERKLGGKASAALLALLLLIQMPALFKYIRAFQRDDLADLTEWLNQNLPDAVLAQDRKVMLPTEHREKFLAYQPPLKARIAGKNIEAMGSVQALREAGVTHVVVSESSYGRYYRKSLRPQEGKEKKYNRSRAMYEELLKGEPLWIRPRGTVIYLHPGLEVYALP